MKSFFTESQWNWVAERFREGYSLAALADFLGVHRETVRRGLVRMKAKPEHRDELEPLSAHRREFLSLDGRDAP